MRVTLIIGAGSTLSDAMKKPKIKRPPLDHGFFSMANKVYSNEVDSIQKYIYESYGYNILETKYDSLEGVLTKIYADIFNPSLEKEAVKNFRKLIKVFNDRIAETTNDIKPTSQRFLYQIISNYIKKGVLPKNLNVITFNQDIQVEKILDKLENTPSYKKYGKIFHFSKCYHIDFDSITSPSANSGLPLFKKDKPNEANGVSILKLHGSLNWYSLHRSSNVRPNALFKSDRKLMLTTRKEIHTGLTFSKKGGKTQHTFPVVVPPVTNKSAILHNKIKPLWKIAEQSLANSDEVLLFGYSCPSSDFESMNLLQRSLRNRIKSPKIILINPDTNIAKRYSDIIEPKELLYYMWPENYIQLKIKNAI